MIDSEIEAYYRLGTEEKRLDLGYFPLERARTEAILQRALPPPPATVLDVGGGAGAYAFWLADRGYQVHLIEPVSLHVEQAERAAARRSGATLASMRLGDARALEWPDGSADAVLLLGPLYHLTARADRLKVLAEARRVVRVGGVVVAAAISRFASLLDGLAQGFLLDPEFVRIVEADLRDGQHRNPTDNPRYFTTAFFHTPDELRGEILDAGWALEDLVPVEGPGAFAQAFYAQWADPVALARVLDAIASVEHEPSLLGASPHLLAIGRATAAPK